MPDIKTLMMIKRGFNMAEYLKEFIDGEDILAAETNANNNYLLDQIRDSSNVLNTKMNMLTSNVNSNMATLRSDINGKIDEANGKIETLEKNDYIAPLLPNWDKAIGLGLGSNSNLPYTFTKRGWFTASMSYRYNRQHGLIYINGVSVTSWGNDLSEGANHGGGIQVMVNVGDVLTAGTNFSFEGAYLVPFKGDE